MAEVVNLRLARKRMARAEKQVKAAENRQAHGRTKAEKSIARSEREAAERKLDGHRLGESPQPGKDPK